MMKTFLTACALLAGPGERACLEQTAAVSPAPFPAARVEKEWTVMAYMNARNNLEKFGQKDLNEMETVGSTDQVNIVAELGLRAGVNRYLVRKDSDPAAITSPAVQSLGRQDMGDYKHLAEFGRWARANYPAKHYMLVIWDHGTGWVDKRGQAVRGVSYDYETRNNITTPQLAMALKEIGRVDLLAFDACLMQMAEVDFEIAPYADYIMGSEQTVPGDGYPYDAALSGLAARPGMGAEELGRAVLSVYIADYEKKKEGASQSLIRTAKLAELAGLTAGWTAAVRSAGEANAVKAAKTDAQHYTNADNKDMSHFIELAGGAFRDPALKQRSVALSAFISGEVVAAVGRAGGVGPQTRGLSVYVPESPYFDEAYNNLQWGKSSGWGAFARWTQTLP